MASVARHGSPNFSSEVAEGQIQQAGRKVSDWRGSSQGSRGGRRSQKTGPLRWAQAAPAPRTGANKNNC